MASFCLSPVSTAAAACGFAAGHPTGRQYWLIAGRRVGVPCCRHWAPSSSKCKQCRIYRLASLCITVIAETVTITQWNAHRFTQSTAVNATESKALEKCSMCYSCSLATSQVDWENELNRFARSNQFSPHILILFSVLWQCMHFLVQLTSTELMQATAKL